MILKLFTQPDCPKCPAAKALVGQLRVALRLCPVPSGAGLRSGQAGKLKIEEYDISTVDGLAEASFYSVLGTPSLIVCDDVGEEVSGWRGEVPSLSAVLKVLK